MYVFWKKDKCKWLYGVAFFEESSELENELKLDLSIWDPFFVYFFFYSQKKKKKKDSIPSKIHAMGIEFLSSKLITHVIGYKIYKEEREIY